ncbi:hypothetical protein I552_6183 [Mycobacterium xenopi 3993]|nr:hypothetical protein I552_6183 [Mycobacterium xenopi 3993]
MRAHQDSESRSPGWRLGPKLTWLGGGHWEELAERHQRSTQAIAGMVVLLDAGLAWLAATVAVGASSRWPTPAILPLTLAFGLVAGAVTRATASGPTRGWPSVAARGAVAIAVGMTVAELAGLAVLSGSIDRRLAEQAVQRADSAPAVAQASTNLDRHARRAAPWTTSSSRPAHTATRRWLSRDANTTRRRRARRPASPGTRGGTGNPRGQRPAGRRATGTRHGTGRPRSSRTRVGRPDRRRRTGARAGPPGRDRGCGPRPGARWAAMYDLTFGSAGVLAVRLLVIALCAALYVLPLILRLWRGETSHDRHAAARAERDRAELQADTAIAVKRAEVRQAAETMRADQQLASARLAAEAQTEIDRAQQRRQVAEALEGHAREYPRSRPKPPVSRLSARTCRRESSAATPSNRDTSVERR